MSIEITNPSTIGELDNKSKIERTEKSTSAMDERPEIDLLQIISKLVKQEEERI